MPICQSLEFTHRCMDCLRAAQTSITPFREEFARQRSQQGTLEQASELDEHVTDAAGDALQEREVGLLRVAVLDPRPKFAPSGKRESISGFLFTHLLSVCWQLVAKTLSIC